MVSGESEKFHGNGRRVDGTGWRFGFGLVAAKRGSGGEEPERILKASRRATGLFVFEYESAFEAAYGAGGVDDAKIFHGRVIISESNFGSRAFGEGLGAEDADPVDGHIEESPIADAAVFLANLQESQLYGFLAGFGAAPFGLPQISLGKGGEPFEKR